jgi:hypothetical protein
LLRRIGHSGLRLLGPLVQGQHPSDETVGRVFGNIAFAPPFAPFMHIEQKGNDDGAQGHQHQGADYALFKVITIHISSHG